MERRVLQESPDEAVIAQQVGCFLYPVFFLSVFKLLQNLWALSRKKKGVIIKYSAV